MTADPRKARILEDRARKLAERGAAVAPRALRLRVVLVEAGRESYGFPVGSLREIVHATPVTQLPGLPAFIPGIASVRGELMSVVDLAELHGRGKTGDSAYFAILESSRGSVAVRIETVIGFRDVFEDEIAETLTTVQEDTGLTHVVTKDFVSLLDVDQLLSSERLIVGANAVRDPAAKGGAR